MGPLKKYMTEEIRKRVRMQTQAVTQYNITELFGQAYIRAQQAELVINGFRGNGIYPVNKNVFQDNDFLDEDLPAVEESSNDPPRDIMTRERISVGLDKAKLGTARTGWEFIAVTGCTSFI